jgi:hypothetical protein
VAALAAVPSEVTSATQALALGALKLIAATGRVIDVTAASNVLAGVSGVAEAARPGGCSGVTGATPATAAAAADPLYGQMLAIAATLAASLAEGQTVAGEEAVAVDSATVQARAGRIYFCHFLDWSAPSLASPSQGCFFLHHDPDTILCRPVHHADSRAACDARPELVAPELANCSGLRVPSEQAPRGCSP